MRKLLTIFLLSALFMSCSSDDDNDNGLTDAQIEKKLVGQWSDAYKGGHQGTLYRFKDDKTFQKYDVLRYDLTPKTIRKSTQTSSSGSYSIKDGNRIDFGSSSSFFVLVDDATITFTAGTLKLDNSEYVEVE